MYTWEGIRKIDHMEAIRLFDDREVFLLYDDNTEGLAESKEDLRKHSELGGEFGIER